MEPMSLRLWRNRVIVVGSFGGFAMGAITMAVAAFLPTYVQAVMGLSATAAGFTLGAMSVSWAVASFAAGRVMVRTSYRLTAVIGAMGLILGTAVLIMLTPQRGLLWRVPARCSSASAWAPATRPISSRSRPA